MVALRSKKLLGLVVLAVLLASAGALWLERTPLLAWYYVRGLAGADEGNRAAWVKRVAGLDRAAWPGLLECLGRQDGQASANAEAALAQIAEAWGPTDAHWDDLAARLTDAFPRLGKAGQKSVLKLHVAWLRQSPTCPTPPIAVVKAAAKLLPEAARVEDKEMRMAALDLAVLLPIDARQTELLTLCRELARSYLRDPEPENRVRAVQLTLHPGIDLLPQVVPLLGDPMPAVRRAAVLAIGPAQEAIATDDLMYWLQDGDADVRRVCEIALRGRGLQEEHLRLARLITDPRPKVRLEVLDHLGNVDLEPGIWLRRLTHDPAPEVRVAAIRAAKEPPLADLQVDLSDRIDQILQNDPSPTVRQQAGYYSAYPNRQSSGSPRP